MPFVKQREKKDVRVCVVLKEHATGNDRLGWTQEKDKKGTEIRSDAVVQRMHQKAPDSFSFILDFKETERNTLTRIP